MSQSIQAGDAPRLLTDLRHLIEQARAAAVLAVNAGLTLMHWRIGQRIRVEMLGGQRAGYGEEIVSTVSRQLAWSHFRELIYLKDPLARDFSAEMCSIERWSVRTLRDRIDSMLFERTALSRQPEELIRLELDTLRSKGTTTSRATCPRWASSCVPARSRDRSSCWSWTRPASMSPST